MKDNGKTNNSINSFDFDVLELGEEGVLLNRFEELQNAHKKKRIEEFGYENNERAVFRGNLLVPSNAKEPDVLYSEITDIHKVEIIEVGDKPDLKSIFNSLICNALPYILLYLTFSSFTLIDLFILRLDYSNINMFNAIVFVQLFTSLLPLTITGGLASGYQYLSAKVYATRNYNLFDKVFYKAQLINLLFGAALILGSFFFIPALEKAFKLNSYTLEFASAFMRPYLFTIVLAPAFFIQINYLLILGCLKYVLILCAGAFGIHIFFTILFIYVIGMDCEGSSLSQLITTILLNIAAYIYIYIENPNYKTSTNIDYELLSGWGEYLKVTSFYILIFIVGVWGLNIIVFISLFDELNNFLAVCIMIWVLSIVGIVSQGFNFSFNIFLVQSISKNYFQTAKSVIKLIFMIYGIVGAICVILTVVLISLIAKIFTADDDVLNLVDQNRWLIGVVQIFFFSISAFSSILIACSFEKHVFISTGICILLVQPAWAAIFVFALKISNQGYMLALIIGSTCLLGILIFFYTTIDFIKSKNEILIHEDKEEEGETKKTN